MLRFHYAVTLKTMSSKRHLRNAYALLGQSPSLEMMAKKRYRCINLQTYRHICDIPVRKSSEYCELPCGMRAPTFKCTKSSQWCLVQQLRATKPFVQLRAAQLVSPEEEKREQ